MSRIMTLINANKPLHQWQVLPEEFGAAFGGVKNPAKVAEIIFAQLSHEKTALLVAQDYEKLTPQVRLQLGELCNRGNCSGHVRKNLQLLNTLLGGKLLREGAKFEQVVTERVEGVNGVRYKTIKVNPAVAGAQQKYAAYDKSAKKEKRK